jgi:hypothetical protein
MLPDAHKNPSRGTQLLHVLFVPHLVMRDLCFPVLLVLPWPHSVLRASVPDAAVNRNCDAGSREHDIGSERKVANWPMVLSEPQASSVKRRPKDYLGTGVLRAITSHHGRCSWRGRRGCRRHRCGALTRWVRFVQQQECRSMSSSRASIAWTQRLRLRRPSRAFEDLRARK